MSIEFPVKLFTENFFRLYYVILVESWTYKILFHFKFSQKILGS